MKTLFLILLLVSAVYSVINPVILGAGGKCGAIQVPQCQTFKDQSGTHCTCTLAKTTNSVGSCQEVAERVCKDKPNSTACIRPKACVQGSSAQAACVEFCSRMGRLCSINPNTCTAQKTLDA